MIIHFERRALQIAIAVFSIVPLLAGGAGVLSGLRIAGGLQTLDAASHMSYLSGLLLGIGILFLSCIRQVEDKAPRIRLLTFIVFIGGLGRLYALVLYGLPDKGMIFGLGMELFITPLICLWQGRVSGRVHSTVATQ